MKMEYDQKRDLLYLWFSESRSLSAETKTIKQGVYADFDRDGKLLGIEILDASEVFEHKFQLEFSLEPSSVDTVTA
mgnify:CR=1 FL=1|jgi:uncharacterized protein YuzE